MIDENKEKLADAIENMDPATFKNWKKLSKPPNELKTAMCAAMVLIGKGSEIPTWAECRKEMSDPQALIDKINDYDRDK